MGVDSMGRLLLSELHQNKDLYAGKEVFVSGWIRTLRDSKVFGFIELNDGSCFRNTQIVFEEDKLQNFKEIVKLGVGSAVNITGILHLTPENKQPFEIKAENY